MLKEIFDAQEKINKRVIKDWDNLCIKDSQQINLFWIQKFHLALQQELAEFIDSFDWKWWTTKENKIENAKVELIDILHFWVSLCQLLGMNADEVFELYMKKNSLNNARQDKGYKEDENVKYEDGVEDNEKLPKMTTDEFNEYVFGYTIKTYEDSKPNKGMWSNI